MREPVASHRTLGEAPVDDRYLCLGTSRLAEKIGPQLGLGNQHEVGTKVAQERADRRGAIERRQQMMRGFGEAPACCLASPRSHRGDDETDSGNVALQARRY